jgi:hypothetical protein
VGPLDTAPYSRSCRETFHRSFKDPATLNGGAAGRDKSGCCRTLTPKQAEYLGLPVEGRYKPDHYRYQASGPPPGTIQQGHPLSASGIGISAVLVFGAAFVFVVMAVRVLFGIPLSK